MPKHVTITNTEYVDLTDNGATTLHKHDHGGQDGLTDDDHTQYINISPSAIERNLITIPNATYKGLIIKAASAQSANTFEVKNSSGVNFFAIGPSGNIDSSRAYTTTGTAGDDRMYELNATVSNYSSGGESFPRAMFANLTTSGANNWFGTSEVIGLQGQVDHNVNVTIPIVHGLFGRVRQQNSGTIAEMNGLCGQAQWTSSGAATNATAINGKVFGTAYATNLHHFLGTQSTFSATNVTNYYGLYLPNISGAATINSAITTNAGNVVFNEGGDASTDFRVESDTEPNMVFLDANGDTNGTLWLGGSTNGIKINKGGEMTLEGTATVYDDLRIEPTVGSTGAKVPVFTNLFGGLYLYDFDDAALATEKEIFFTVQLPHGWKEGSSVEPHVHWVNKTAGTAGHVVRWGLEYSKASIGSTFSSTPTTVYATTIVGGGDITVQYEHLITDFSAIDMTGDTISPVLICRLFRNSSDAADTYTGTAGLLYIDWHVELNSMGSKSEYTK